MMSPNFMVIGLQIGKLHRAGGIRPPPAVLDSKKPGLFRVKGDKEYRDLEFSNHNKIA